MILFWKSDAFSCHWLLHQERCPTSRGTRWSTVPSWWRTTWSKRPSCDTGSCQVTHAARQPIGPEEGRWGGGEAVTPFRQIKTPQWCFPQQTTCRVTLCRPSAPASSPRWSPPRWTWWRRGTWTRRPVSTAALSTAPGPCWPKRGPLLSTRGEWAGQSPVSGSFLYPTIP